MDLEASIFYVLIHDANCITRFRKKESTFLPDCNFQISRKISLAIHFINEHFFSDEHFFTFQLIQNTNHYNVKFRQLTAKNEQIK